MNLPPPCSWWSPLPCSAHGCCPWTLIPLLCVQFLKPKKESSDYNRGFYQKYRELLTWVLRHRLLSLAATAVLFAMVMSGFKYVPKIFFPPSDRLYFKTELELPLGTAIERTETIVEELEAFIKEEFAGKLLIAPKVSPAGSVILAPVDQDLCFSTARNRQAPTMQ